MARSVLDRTTSRLSVLTVLLFHVYNITVVHCETFNVAFAASVQSRLEQLLSQPSIRALNPLANSFSSRWDYIYSGDESEGGRNHQLIHEIDINGTKKYMWTLMKPSDDGTSGVDFVYAGFENGMFIGYKGPAPIQYVEMLDGNSTCPGLNISMRCRRSYENSTDQTSGEKVGLPSQYIVYDPRYRPWYIQSSNSVDGDTWTDPYVFASNGELGITATKRIQSATGQFLGIAGVDYKLSTLDEALANQEKDSSLATSDYVTYVVENDGDMIASSDIGASVETINGVNTQVSSYNSSNVIIATTSQFIARDRSKGGGGGWAASNGTVLDIPIAGYGLYWTQVRRIANAYGLIWYVVVVELVSCDRGYYSPPDYDGTDCVRCPTGAQCDGGSSLPYPLPGYWVDRTEYRYGGDIFRCVIDTCVGYEAREDKILQDHSNVNCWSQADFNRSICDADNMMCATGSTGPLCGTCLTGYHYDSGSRRCENCLNRDANIPFYVFWSLVFISILGVVIFASGSLGGEEYVLKMKSCALQFKDQLVKYFPFNLLKHIDSGMAKVIWNTTQIISTIPWNLQMKFPDPFSSLLESHLVFFQLDFFPLHCFFENSNFLTRVYIVSLTPLILVCINGLIYLARCAVLLGFIPHAWFHPITMNRRILSSYASQHAYFALVLSYLVLPVVSMVQFSALECVKLREGDSYLRADTSIDCESKEYKLFVNLDALLIVAYQSVPLIWFVLLWRARHKLNPQLNQTSIKIAVNRRKESVAVGFRERDHDSSIRHLAFLWEEYRPTRWYYEVFEMYRRILFIAVLPLVGNSSELRAVMGTLIAILMISIVREASPFIRTSTNLLLLVAQFQILLTFYAAVLITSGALDRLHLSSLALGGAIFCVNLAVITVVVCFTAARLYGERETQKFKVVLSDEEYNLVNEVMLQDEDSVGSNDHVVGGSFVAERALELVGGMNEEVDLYRSSKDIERVSEIGSSVRFSVVTKEGGGLGKLVLSSKDIVLQDKVGTASFGDIIKGMCFRQPAVIKTLQRISPSNVSRFKTEIITTSCLRHPNIVGFIGACWDRELICMVMEYVSDNNLSTFLTEHGCGNLGNGDLSWGDPLLRLVIDIARGMYYLHEGIKGNARPSTTAAVDMGEPILNLNLNPSNCLLNDFLCVKLNLDLNKWSESHHSLDSLTRKIEHSHSHSPLFMAPELLCSRSTSANNTETLSDVNRSTAADVYSFGMILTNVVLYKKDFLPFVLHCWKQHVKHLNGGRDMFGVRSMLKSIFDHSWQLQAVLKRELEVQQCPSSILKLIAKCCSLEPSERPSFKEILNELKTECSEEIDMITSKEQLEPFRNLVERYTYSSHSPEEVYVQKENPMDSLKTVSTTSTTADVERHSQRINAASVFKSNQVATGNLKPLQRDKGGDKEVELSSEFTNI